MKYIHTNFTNKYAEIHQTLEIKFSFVKRVKAGIYTNLFAFVKCRDFLGDVLCAEHDKKKYSIYGFSYDGKKSMRVQTSTMLALEFPSQEVKEQWLQNWNTYKEQLASISKISMGTVYNQNGNYILLKAPKIWSQSVATLSYYTFLLKGMGYKLENNDFFVAVENTTATNKTWDGKPIIQDTVEANYIKKIPKERFNIFIRKLKTLVKNLNHPSGLENRDISNMHNGSGFYSVCCFLTGDIGKKLSKYCV